LLLSCVRAQVEPGEAEAGLQTHQHSHTATIVASVLTTGRAMPLSANGLGVLRLEVVQFHKPDRLWFTRR
jgi:hypothetical protein